MSSYLLAAAKTSIIVVEIIESNGDRGRGRIDRNDFLFFFCKREGRNIVPTDRIESRICLAERIVAGAKHESSPDTRHRLIDRWSAQRGGF